MPRLARLDAPGLLQHVMARGIERRNIFKDDKDRKSFLGRLALILEETKTLCYAWSLIPNHFHLLLHTGPTPLSKVMCRLMTGYAVSFNRRHRRAGHLFQNRYKSVICEEDPYLLELIRYIHLNPIRADLVKDLKELDKFPWAGHSAILGKRKNPLIPESSKVRPISYRQSPISFSGEGQKLLAEKTLEDVLEHFGDTIKVARRRYRQFVSNGIDQGTRTELQGGGLVRSAGGNKEGLLGRKNEEREKGDERILGSGSFVETILGNSSDTEPRIEARISLELLSRKVASHFKITEEDLRSPVKKKSVIEAKSAFGYLAMKQMGYSGREIGRFLNMRSYSAIRRAQEGKKVIDKSQFLWNLAQE